MVLHTLNAMPSSNAFRDCLRCVGKGDAVLLLGDGVYCAIDGSDASKLLQDCGARVQVLEPDSLAAGLAVDSLAFQILDMDGFAALTEYYPRQLAWY